MSKPTSKVIQITATRNMDNIPISYYLCDDGSCWFLFNREWECVLEAQKESEAKQEPTINHIVDANKKAVCEALEELKDIIKNPELYEDYLADGYAAAKNLVNALDTQRKSENLYMKEEEITFNKQGSITNKSYG
jgi:hypothetical protein